MESKPQLDKRLPSLDGIRAVCIGLVIGCHAAESIGFPEAWKEPSRFLFNGHLGVTIFFVLSGFLITLLLVNEEKRCEKISLNAFYARRFIRILPVYFTYLLVIVLLDVATGMDVSAGQYATTATFTKDFGCRGWIDAHLWSLSVEEQFYIFWPLTLVFLPRQFRFRVALFIVVMAPMFRLFFLLGRQDMLLQFSFMTNADSMMIGSLCAMMLAADHGKLFAFLKRRPAMGRAACLAAIYLTWILQKEVGVFWLIPLAVTIQATAAAYLIASYATVPTGLGFRLLNLRPLCYIGLLSYSWYMWQQPFFAPSNIYGYSSPPIFLVFPFNLVASFAVAMLSYHALEMPLVALRKRFRPRPSGERLRAGATAGVLPAKSTWKWRPG